MAAVSVAILIVLDAVIDADAQLAVPFVVTRCRFPLVFAMSGWVGASKTPESNRWPVERWLGPIARVGEPASRSKMSMSVVLSVLSVVTVTVLVLAGTALPKIQREASLALDPSIQRGPAAAGKNVGMVLAARVVVDATGYRAVGTLTCR